MNAKAKQFLFLVAVALFWFSQYVYTSYFTPYMSSLGIAASLAGTIVGAYGFTQLVLRIPFGVAADFLKNHRLFLFLGYIFIVIASAVLMLSQSAPIFLLARLLSGAASSTWVSFTLYFSAFSTGSDASGNMGKLMAANNLGVFLAYITGGLLYEAVGIRTLFVISGAVAAIALVLLCFLKPNGTAAQRPPLKLKDLGLVAKDGQLWNLSLLAAAIQFITCATASSFTSNYAKSLGADGLQLGIVSALYTLSGILGASLISTRFSKRFSDRFIVILGFLLTLVYCAGVPLCKSVAPLYVIQFIGGFGKVLVMTLLMADAVKNAVPAVRSTAMGVYQSVYGLGMTVGPIVMGAILEKTDGFGPAFYFMAGASLLCAVWAFFSRYDEKKRAEEK
ncbi:MAG: MFS transporter [Oscillospiraceae bacterium]|nr:MFS transporter [Oscillospiraceae bacterium]